MYENGYGLTKDYEMAVMWYSISAATNNVEGQFYLAHMYKTGKGVAMDKDLAASFYRKAVSNWRKGIDTNKPR